MKIKLKYNKFQIAMEIIAALLLFAMTVYLLLRWGDIPSKIPGHYNAAGEIDRWGEKSEILLIPISGVALYLLITLIGFFPAIWNVPVKITEANKDKVYGNVKSMILLMKAEALAFFFYLNYSQIQAERVSSYLLPIVIAVILGTFLTFYLRLRMISK